MIKLNFTPFPSLTTQRLRLRRMELQDEQEVYALRSDERVNLHLDRQPAASIQDARAFIEKINAAIDRNEAAYWAICLKENPRLIGTICYFNFSDATESAELGYELHPFYQHKGIMHEALSVIIPFAFHEVKLKRIIACPTPANVASIRLLERNGFLLEEDVIEPKDEVVKYVLHQK